MTESKDRIVIHSARDVIELVNNGIAVGGNEKAITLIALGGIFIDAYDFTSLAFGLKDIAHEFQLGPVAEGVVGASIMVGALVGALAGGYLVDKLGRYRLFMADMVFFVVAAIACALSPNAEVLTVSRFVMGIGIGLDFPVALAFLAEYSARKGKGSRVTLWQPMWYVATGTSFAILLPLYFLLPAAYHSTWLWRIAVGFGALPALVVMLVRHRYMDESPAWAAQEGDLDRAAGILKKSYGLEVEVAPDADRTPPIRPRNPLHGFARLFEPRYRRRTIQAGLVGMTQSMQYYAVGFFLPVIVAGFLAQGRLSSIVAPLIFNLVFGVSGGFAGAYLISRIGSWKLAASGFAVALVALVGLGLLGRPSSTAGLLLAAVLLGAFVFFHAYGPGAQGMTMATLSYPTSIRGIGSGFGQAVLRIGSMISLLLFPVLSADLGAKVFFVVALAPLVGLIALAICRFEPTHVDVDAEDYAAPVPRP